MSHALLLRLFLSPSFFSVHVALRYLKTYSDNIGITYYLTRRLRELDTQELRDVWGFICHLLVSKPSKSRALECFVVEVAQRSTHIAMITLWFMQASLRDLALTRHDSPSFIICQRILLKCHEIIFEDLPPPVPSPYSMIDVAPFQSCLTRTKVRAHIEPSLVGIGLVLAGVPGMPQLTEIMGEVAIEQGRVNDEVRSLQVQDDHIVPGVPLLPNKYSREGQEDDLDETQPEQEASRSWQEASSQTPPSTLGNLDVVKNIKANFPRRSMISAAQTTPALPLYLRSRVSYDPLGQLDPKPVPPQTTPSQSSPSIPSSRTPAPLITFSTAEAILQKYDSQYQSHLLRSHYCRSEVQFLLSLENISNRLLVVPRPARVSALRAELTALNHRLPAEICMPMWCPSSDIPRPSEVALQPHHRIVRIPPGESVVLNSAERAPYLLLIEILHGDLDFDPTTRGNKEVLKKIVDKQAQRKGASRDSTMFTNSSKASNTYTTHSDPMSSDVPFGEDNPSVVDSFVDVINTTPITTSFPDEEEIDLVEQLYGTDHTLRSRQTDLSESIVLPPAPKNKELDMVAWSRPSISLSPALERGYSNTPSALSSSSVSGGGHLIDHSQHSPATANGDGRFLSLDEYSERMRTAAIMLTQLNANLIREPVTSLPPSLHPLESTTSHGTSWLPGSNGLLGSNEQTKASGPLHPSLVGVQDSNASAPATPTRIKLQHSEAAAIRDRIMKEMLALEEERMERMREHRDGEGMIYIGEVGGGSMRTLEDEKIIRRELDKVDPSAVVFSESWATKKSRIRHSSPYGHLANWDCVSVIVKSGGDLRQEQLAVQLIQEFERIWREENTQCWVRYFRILITGGTSGLVETITDAVSIHSIKKAQYARRLAEGKLGDVTLLDHFKTTYGDPSSAKFARAQRKFAKSLAGYSIVTYLLQIKDRHNGNILLDREGHLIHIDFGFMLSNSPGNIGFEAAPFKLPPEYIEVLGGVHSQPFLEFRRLFRDGFEASRKHCDRIITLVELMQKDSTLPCFAAFGEQTANQLRERFQPTLTHSLVGEYVDRLIDSSLGSNWTRLYDSYQYYSQSIL